MRIMLYYAYSLLLKLGKLLIEQISKYINQISNLDVFKLNMIIKKGLVDKLNKYQTMSYNYNIE